MQDGISSKTAQMTATLRAAHNRIAPEPKILRDDVAEIFCGLSGADELQAALDEITNYYASLGSEEAARSFVRRSADFVCMRSRQFEEQMKQAIKEGCEQIIILGAGLDSTAYRFTDVIGAIPLYEIDFPATQKWKQDKLREHGIEPPSNVHFIGLDFESDTLEAAMARGGVRKNAHSMMSWLGVTMYLTDESVKTTLNILGAFAPKSRLVMDFIKPNFGGGEQGADEIEKMSEVVSKMGEPLRAQYTQADLQARLEAAGFTNIIFHTANELINNYLNGKKEAYSMPDETTSLLTAQI